MRERKIKREQNRQRETTKSPLHIERGDATAKESETADVRRLREGHRTSQEQDEEEDEGPEGLLGPETVRGRGLFRGSSASSS